LLPPPLSTLFPYTTLFRSANFGLHGRRLRQHGPVQHERNRNAENCALNVSVICHVFIPVIDPSSFTLKPVILTPSFGRRISQKRDRKSTRLNSSHRTISYA